MPYPSQIDRDAILRTARQIIERDGLAKLSLRLLAEELGVSAPSLYRYFRNKKALLRAIAEETVELLFIELYAAMESESDVEQRPLAVAKAYHRYAHAHPVAYQLVYVQPDPDLLLDTDYLVPKVLPLQALLIPLAGAEQSLAALRGLLAIIHGWVMLELANQLRRGGDLNQHFEQAVQTYLIGLQSGAQR